MPARSFHVFLRNDTDVPWVRKTDLEGLQGTMPSNDWKPPDLILPGEEKAK